MQPHLILDEQSVAESRGVTFHLNPATKHPENPVMLPGEPHQWDSLCVSWPGTVLYNQRDQKFRCWYLGMDIVQKPDRTWHTGYAESEDGIRWTKPDLGQVEFLGRPTNQIQPNWIDWPASVPEPPWGTYLLSLVFENPLPSAPIEERFGSYWWHPTTPDETGKNVKRYPRKTLAFSPDGICWTYHCTPYEPDRKNGEPFQDICQLLYNPDANDRSHRVIGYTQFQRKWDWDGRERVRHIGLVQGKDFRHIANAAEPIALAPQAGIDEELHFATVKKIGGTYLMLFESNRFSKNPIHGDLRLAVSEDGLKFRRLHSHTPLLPTGPKGSWDENLLVTSTAAIQEVGDEFYIFYFGCPNTYNSFPVQYAVTPERRGSMFAPSYLGLATLPRDRFAYATGNGTLATHPLEIGCGGLWLNAEGEDIVVTAFGVPRKLSGNRGGPTEVGTPKHGKLGAERRQTVYRKVVWNDVPPHGNCSLQISLTSRGKLFSVAF